LEARAATDVALRNLLLALGAVALVVGGVGITNVMVISVLERRGEIGVRRALGARRAHIASQFLAEAGVLAALGGLVGVAFGTAVTATYARIQGWRVDVPVPALAAGAATALAVGLLAGVSPAIRAARLDPAEALRPT
jgi:putative ABC transport system permease protein